MGIAPTMMSDFLRQCGGVAVIDGGFATELERHGADLNDPLWSAKCLLTSPDLIRKVHLDYLEAGADIILTASYQATIQGFQNKGYSLELSEDMLRKSVEIARESRELYYTRCREASTEDSPDNKILKERPILVAASVGSYGAYLADGSEYSGDYGDAMDLEFLKNFHRRRVKILAEAGPDLIAFETVPNKLEAQAFARLLDEENINIPSWLSFNSKDGVNVVSGDSLTECVAVAESSDKIVAVGINCTPPRFINDLILSIKKVSAKPILIYPNSGESYDADRKEWYFLAMEMNIDGIEGSLVLIKQGAEARVYESNFVGRRSIIKERFSKKYRHPLLDSKLTLKRLNAEARCLTKARKLGVSTPVLYAVDPLMHTLTFEYVEGSAVKDILLDFGLHGIVQERLDDIATQIGDAIGKLHDGGLIHGDLTTSNMLVRDGTNKLALIDFGLSFTSTLPEDKAVDLYVLERALLSMHSSCGNVMDRILSAYRKSSKQWCSTLNKLAQVRQRGRKRTMLG